MTARRTSAAGLTFIELLISIAILGVIATALPLVLDGALGLRERQDDELRLEREIGALADQWARDTEAAHAIDLPGPDCVLHLAAGDIRFRVSGGNVWRETRRTGHTSWSAHPKRPLARLATGETIAFRAGLRTVTMEVTATRGPWSRTVAPRRLVS